MAVLAQMPEGAWAFSVTTPLNKERDLRPADSPLTRLSLEIIYLREHGI